MNLLRFFTFSAALLLITGCGGTDDPPPGPPPDNSESISAINGFYYKGEMGTSTVNKPITFQVRDADLNPLTDKWVHFKRLEGDGVFNNDSVKSNVGGFVTAQYTFSGSLGHAEIEAVIRNNDSTSVIVRADLLTPGIGGQGQYVLFIDFYEDVLALNGAPANVDFYLNNHPFMYATYEAATGVVVMLWDDSLNYDPNDTSDVFGVIVSDDQFLYEGKIADSIGIGSSYQALVDYFGVPDTIIEDVTDPQDPEWRIRYLSHGMTLYATPSDTVITEIHLTEYIVQPGRQKIALPDSLTSPPSKSYRLYK